MSTEYWLAWLLLTILNAIVLFSSIINLQSARKLLDELDGGCSADDCPEAHP